MPHRRHRHHALHSAPASPPAALAQTRSYIAQPAPAAIRPDWSLHNVPPGMGALMGGGLFVGIVLIASGLIDRSQRAARKAVDDKKWGAARELRELAEVEEHVAESAVRMLSAREKVARAKGSMYGAVADTHALNGTALSSQRLLEGIMSGDVSGQPLSLPPVTSSSFGGRGTVDQAAVARIALQGIVDNGADLTAPGASSAWRNWERRIRSEHSALTAQAIIESAKGMLGGSF